MTKYVLNFGAGIAGLFARIYARENGPTHR